MPAAFVMRVLIVASSTQIIQPSAVPFEGFVDFQPSAFGDCCPEVCFDF
jgi:hypothetical protein